MPKPVAAPGITALLAVFFAVDIACSAAKSEILSEPRIGFRIQIVHEGEQVGDNKILLQYHGEIVHPLARNLREIATALRGRFGHVRLDIDSVGGALDEAEKVIALLDELKRSVMLTTSVQHGHRCLSACVIIFMQGTRRLAGGSSSWMFHGACGPFDNRPVLEPTDRFLQLLRQGGADPQFLCHLAERAYLSSPGKLWLSGYELFHVWKANVVTELLDPWQPEAVIELPFDPQIRSR